MRPDVSIIMCCHNSEGRVGESLRFLAQQNLNGLIAELIVVDNASTDSTKSTVLKFWEEFGSPFKLILIYEGKSGLINARRSGVLATSGATIVFCDDDNLLDSNYIFKVHSIFLSLPNVGAVGGLGVLKSSYVPWWFSAFSNQYACFKQVGEVKYLFGAGLSCGGDLLRNIFSSNYNFQLTGRIGNSQLGGEDHEICILIRKRGYKLIGFEDLVFYHKIPTNRLNLRYLVRLISGAGYSEPIVWLTEVGDKKWFYLYLPYRILRLFAGYLRILIKYFRQPRVLLLKLALHNVYIFCALITIFRLGINSR